MARAGSELSVFRFTSLWTFYQTAMVPGKASAAVTLAIVSVGKRSKPALF